MSHETYLIAHETIEQCRSCESARLTPILDLGNTPLADRLLTADELTDPEPLCPLTLTACEDCSLMQIRETVSPEVLFGADYPYYSSVSGALLRHFRGTVQAARARRELDGSSLVVELASNDGYLLRNYLEAGIPALGIDPASGPVEKARSHGVDTINDFFTEALACQLRDDGRRADVIHANNVLAHVSDTNGFVAGISTIVKPDGIVIIECPYIRDLVEACEFDTIYHQHLCYFSVTSVKSLFERHGLHLIDIERIPIHGGSLRLFFSKTSEPAASVDQHVVEEHTLGLGDPTYFADFAHRVVTLKEKLTTLVDTLKRRNGRLAAYGAAAKACTLLSYTGIGAAHLECIVDRNEFKQGRYFPGCHLPIRDPAWLLEAQPDYTIILPWNFADEIMEQQAEYIRRGGRFVIPVPEPIVV